MRNVIYVLSYGKQWSVQCEHCGTAIFGKQFEAIRYAKAHVANLIEGALSLIRIQGEDGKFRTEWTYGKDPFPPSG